MSSDFYNNFISCCLLEKKQFDNPSIIVDQDALTLRSKFRNEICNEIADLIDILSSNKISLASYANQGMSLGVVVSHILNIPFLYLRNSPKKYGLKKQIEGQLTANQKIVFFSLSSPTVDLYNKTKTMFVHKNSRIVQWVSIVGNEFYSKNFRTPHHFLYSQQKIFDDLKVGEIK